MQLAQSLQKSPNYPVERTAASHRVAAAAHRSVEFMHNDDKDHPTRWPAGELRKVNPSSIMRLSVIPEGDPLAGMATTAVLGASAAPSVPQVVRLTGRRDPARPACRGVDRCDAKRSPGVALAIASRGDRGGRPRI